LPLFSRHFRRQRHISPFRRWFFDIFAIIFILAPLRISCY
jgi:hypothetical protein